MMVTTTESLPGRNIVEVLGIVFGSCVQTKHIGKDIGAGLRTIVGGEARGYTELMEESRRVSMQRMIDDAKKIERIFMEYAIEVNHKCSFFL